MQWRRPESFQNSTVPCRTVTGILSPAVFRKAGTDACHQLVAHDFGENRRRSDTGATAIPLHDGGRERWIEPRERQSVVEDMIDGTEPHKRTAHG